MHTSFDRVSKQLGQLDTHRETHVRTVTVERFFAPAAGCCQIERRFVVDITHVEVGMMIQEKSEAIGFVIHGCNVERRLHGAISSIDIRMRLEELIDSKGSTLRCIVQRRVHAAVSSIDIRMLVEEKVDATLVALQRCQMERCDVDQRFSLVVFLLALGIAMKGRAEIVGMAIGIGMSLEKELDALIVAFERCEMERCVARARSHYAEVDSLLNETHGAFDTVVRHRGRIIQRH